jgi:hypothetical protein
MNRTARLLEPLRTLRRDVALGATTPESGRDRLIILLAGDDLGESVPLLAEMRALKGDGEQLLSEVELLRDDLAERPRTAGDLKRRIDLLGRFASFGESQRSMINNVSAVLIPNSKWGVLRRALDAKEAHVHRETWSLMQRHGELSTKLLAALREIPDPSEPSESDTTPRQA